MVFRIIKNERDFEEICFNWLKNQGDIKQDEIFNFETLDFKKYENEVIIGNANVKIKDFYRYFYIFGYGNVAVDWFDDGTDTIYFRIKLTGNESNRLSSKSVESYRDLLCSNEFGVEMQKWEENAIEFLTFRQWFD